MKSLLYILCGFIAAYLLQASTGLVFLYAPAIIFPLILPYSSRRKRLTYFTFSIGCYTLIIVSLTMLKLSFPVITTLFFLSAAIMFMVYALLSGVEEYADGLKAILFFTARYALIVFLFGLFLKKNYLDEHITYIIVPAWYWLVGKQINFIPLHQL